MTQTELSYLNDTYADKGISSFVRHDRDEQGLFIVLQSTIFYPQGGGQPSDVGTLSFGRKIVPVKHVSYHAGEVRHYLEDDLDDFPAHRADVEMQIDLEYRILNARYHTAGHLLDNVVQDIARHDGVVAIKGQHYPDKATVTFRNTSQRIIADELATVNERLALAIANDFEVVARDATIEEVQNVQPHLVPFLPSDKDIRVVQIGDFPLIPCGGTHVSKLSELLEVHVTGAKNKKDRKTKEPQTKISYELRL